MSSQTRISKRKHSTVEPDSPSPSRASQRMRKPTTKLLQGTLGFPSRLSQVSTPTKSPTLVSEEQSQASTRQNSLSPTPQSRQSSKSREPKDTTISSKRRTWWEIDFDLEGLQEFKTRAPTLRSIGASRISWIYLHGRMLKNKHGAKHWVCRHCYFQGDTPTVRVMAAASTTSCSKHLKTVHSIYQPGKEPNDGTAVIMEDFLEG
jgi:hypothetical protein